MKAHMKIVFKLDRKNEMSLKEFSFTFIFIL